MSAISSANLTYSAVISVGISNGFPCSMHWKAIEKGKSICTFIVFIIFIHLNSFRTISTFTIDP